jgi:hypothetical protein
MSPVLAALDFEARCDIPTCQRPARWAVRARGHRHPGRRDGFALVCEEHGCAAQRMHGAYCETCEATVAVTAEPLR